MNNNKAGVNFIPALFAFESMLFKFHAECYEKISMLV